MEIIIQKFGGSSVANAEIINKVCEHIIREKEKGKKVVVVVSAQGDTTDKLIEEEQEITVIPSKREHDVLVSTGEQISVAKLAMSLQDKGHNAVSFLGWQVPIITDSNYGDANIIKVGKKNILKQLKKGNIVIIAGFQGIDKQNNITTLGRGGSDTTAIALAYSLKAQECEIYTDVDGVYSKDPNKNEDAFKYDTITYDNMLEMSNRGAKVLHNKCIELAKKNNVQITVKSTFLKESIGTIIK